MIAIKEMQLNAIDVTTGNGAAEDNKKQVGMAAFLPSHTVHRWLLVLLYYVAQMVGEMAPEITLMQMLEHPNVGTWSLTCGLRALACSSSLPTYLHTSFLSFFFLSFFLSFVLSAFTVSLFHFYCFLSFVRSLFHSFRLVCLSSSVSSCRFLVK